MLILHLTLTYVCGFRVWVQRSPLPVSVSLSRLSLIPYSLARSPSRSLPTCFAFTSLSLGFPVSLLFPPTFHSVPGVLSQTLTSSSERFRLLELCLVCFVAGAEGLASCNMYVFEMVRLRMFFLHQFLLVHGRKHSPDGLTPAYTVRCDSR